MPARLGQHFLTSLGARDLIINAAEIKPGDKVLEIGPGRGILTRALLETGAEICAVEMDERLAEGLQREFSEQKRLRVIRDDFLRTDLQVLGAGPFNIVANLPYSVGTPILQRILSWPEWHQAILMFQKEVAERLIAEPGGPDYGILSLSVYLWAEVEILFEVGRGSFSPPPRVDSSVVRLTRRKEPLLDIGAQEKFFKVAKAAFHQRRKIASGPIASALGLPRATVEETLVSCGLVRTCRAQDIPPETYLKLPQLLGL